MVLTLCDGADKFPPARHQAAPMSWFQPIAKLEIGQTCRLPGTPPPQGRMWWPVGVLTHVLVVLGVGVVVLFTYGNTLRSTGFALDNKFIILEDPRMRDACAGKDLRDAAVAAECRRQNREFIKLIFTEDYWWPKAVSGLYRPLTTLSLRFNYATLGNGTSAVGYHLTNLLLHWLMAVLVYFVGLVLFRKIWPALLMAGLFATHPVTTESVTNIIGRADIFAGITVVGGLLLYVKATHSRGLWRVMWLTAMAVLVGLGVFCKESAATVAGVVVLYDFTYRLQRLRPSWWRNLAANFWRFFWRGYVALVPPLALMFGVRAWVYANQRPPELPFVDNPLVGADFWSARLTAIKVLGRYLALLVWPARLSCDYSYNQIPVVDWQFRRWEDWQAVVALGVVLAVLGLAAYNYRRQKAVFFLTLFGFVTILPTSNLVPNPTFGQSLFDNATWCIGSIMAERFLYLPLVGFAGCVVVAVFTLCYRLLEVPAWFDFERRWVPLTLAVVVLGGIMTAFGVRAAIRNLDWENDITLWKSAVEVAPNSFKSYKSYAYALYENDPEGKNIDEIIRVAEKALEITDRTQIVLLHLGAYYRIKGDQLAERIADGSIRVTPAARPWYEKSVAVLERAVPLDREFNADNRRKEIARGRDPSQILDIGNHEIYWNLGLGYLRLGMYDKALEAYAYMRHLTPTNADAYLNTATAYLAAGRLEEALVWLLQTLFVDSTRQDALQLTLELYRQSDQADCALLYTPEPRLNADCEFVRRHICRAYMELARTLYDARRANLAKQAAQLAVDTYKCPTNNFAPFLPAAKPAS